MPNKQTASMTRRRAGNAARNAFSPTFPWPRQDRPATPTGGHGGEADSARYQTTKGSGALLHNKATLTKKRINTNLVRHAFQTPPRFCCYPRALPRLIDLQPRSQCGASANPKGRGHCCSGPCRALCRHERFSPSHSITPKHNVPAWYMLLK